METITSNDLIDLIVLHYNQIEIYDRQEDGRFVYKGHSIKNKGTYWEYEFEILDRAKLSNN